MQQPNENNAEIIDFNSYKQHKDHNPEGATASNADANSEFTPMLVWYPMWVMVPKACLTPPTPPAS